MERMMEMLPFLVPLLILELLLMLVALVHVFKHTHYRFGNRVMWVLVVVFITIVGPVVYLTFGRADE